MSKLAPMYEKVESSSSRRLHTPNLFTYPERIEWLELYPNLVPWSPMNRYNSAHQPRGVAQTKHKNFDIEIPGKLYSLWGSLHPISAVFGKSRGKQYLAINVVACCVATIYQLSQWNTELLDSIVIGGNDYFNQSVDRIKVQDYQMPIEALCPEFSVGDMRFKVYFENVFDGYMYSMDQDKLNLGTALVYFFTNYHYGVLQCDQRSVAIGLFNAEFFMFDCQNYGGPLFPVDQGAAYVLRTNSLQTLLYCIIMTLNISEYDAMFTIHKINILNLKSEILIPKGEAHKFIL